MNRQLRYPLIFLLAFFLLLTSTRTSGSSLPNSAQTTSLPVIPVLVSPSGSIGTENLPTYTWSESAGVTWYHIQVSSVDSDGLLLTVYDAWHNASEACADSVCSVTPALVLAPGNYRWSMQVWNHVDAGPWSSPLDFYTTPPDTYYVSSNGDDSNPGTEASPWKTIQKAASLVTAGNTVVVQAGDFPERVTVDHAGSDGLPITFEAQGPVVMHGFTVNSDYIVIRGFEITDTPNNDQDGWGIWVHGHNCLIEDNYIHYATRGGILLASQPGTETAMANCVVRNNRLYRNSTVGIEVSGRDHLIEDNEIWGTIQFHPDWINQPTAFADADGIRFFGSGHIFRGNYIHDISLTDPENINPHIDGFQTWDADDVEAGNNCIFEQNRIMLPDRDTAGFQLAGDTNHLIIKNNIVKTFAGIRGYKITRSPFTSPSELFVLNNLFIGDLAYDSWPVGITLQDTTNLVIKNNIFLDQPDQVIDVSGSSGIEMDYNLAYNSDGSSPRSPIGAPLLNNLWGVNPVFVSPDTGDYHLQAESSAIDAGTFLNEVNDDFDGNSRPQGNGYDIGVYEYVSVSQSQ